MQKEHRRRLQTTKPASETAGFEEDGRCERIRTFDPLHPMQVRYQAAPHTEAGNYSLLQWRTCASALRSLRISPSSRRIISIPSSDMAEKLAATALKLVS